MFPPQVQLIFDARTALEAANSNDPRFEALVLTLMQRLQISREQCLQNIVQLANGNITI